jgi:Uma2 family endonuclease
MAQITISKLPGPVAAATGAPAERIAIPPIYDNMAEFVHGLGDIPLSRILFDPWPGTATERDLLEFVERDKRLVELVDGTLVEKPMGNYESWIAQLISHAILSFVLPRGLGYVTGEAGMMRLASGRVRMPDVSFISVDRLPGGEPPREPIPSLSPDLAVEVLSDSNTESEIDQKLREYFSSGTKLAWIVDPVAKSVAVYSKPDRADQVLSVKDVLDGGSVLPGFVLPLVDIFEMKIRKQ